MDLPEHFHSKDIIDKIELLARLVADNTSFSMTDWDQKSSAGVSHSDAGFVGTDTWKDELAPSSNPEFDEFKRKHEELQNKLYVLAEHNKHKELLWFTHFAFRPMGYCFAHSSYLWFFK